MTKAIPDKADVVIVGGGPGGLSCAQLLAKSGLRTVLLEKKQGIGHKICAGGVTWNGLLQYAPTQLIERSFPVQHIVSRLQHIQIREDNPIVATISRVRLGEWMAEEAKEAGALLILGAQVVALGEGAWYSPDEKRIDRAGSINVLTTQRPSPLAKGNPSHTNLVQVTKA